MGLLAWGRILAQRLSRWVGAWATWMGLATGRFDREAGAGRESQQPRIHSLFSRWEPECKLEGKGAVFVLISVLLDFGEAQHRVK